MNDYIFKYIYPRSFLAVTAVIVVIIALWALIARHSEKRLWRVINSVLFTASVVIILDLTVISRTPAVSTFYPVPFYSFVEARTYPQFYRETFMNALLFFPYGLSMPYMLADKVKRKPVWTILSACEISLLIEISQLVFKLGRCETDDVIMNTLGASVGTLAYLISYLIDKKRNKKKRD